MGAFSPLKSDPQPTLGSYELGIVADPAQAQGGSPLTKTLNVIAVCATLGDTVTLPPAELGRIIIVINRGAQAAEIYPASGQQIDTLLVDQGLSIAANELVFFIGESSTRWAPTMTGG